MSDDKSGRKRLEMPMGLPYCCEIHGGTCPWHMRETTPGGEAGACVCGHSVERHSYETSGLLKPECDDCTCKAYREASPQPDTGPGSALEALKQWENDTESPASFTEGNAFMDGWQMGTSSQSRRVQELKAERETHKKIIHKRREELLLATRQLAEAREALELVYKECMPATQWSRAWEKVKAVLHRSGSKVKL